MLTRPLLLVLFLFCSNALLGQNKDVLTGKWLTATGDAQILIYPSGNKFSGRIVWLKKPNDSRGKPETDDKNPDQKLTTRPILGMEILKGFSYSEKAVWEGGTIYDPKTGRTYSCRISLADGDKLNVRGFVGISMLGRTEVWSRVR